MKVGDTWDQVSSKSVQCSSSNSKSSSSSVSTWHCPIRLPQSRDFLQLGQWPSRGRSCPGSSRRNSAARQIIWALRGQPGWGQHRGPSSSCSIRAHSMQLPLASPSSWRSLSVSLAVSRFGTKGWGGTGPKAMGMCGGGTGESSWRKSGRSQRSVRGRRTHGGTRSMCANTRRWKAKDASLRRRGPT